MDTNKPAFPNSNELLGYWVGLTENLGDAQTYWILITENTVIAQSTLCPAYHPGHQNLRHAEGEDVEAFRLPTGVDARVDVVHNEQSVQALHTFDPLEMRLLERSSSRNTMVFPIRHKYLSLWRMEQSSWLHLVKVKEKKS